MSIFSLGGTLSVPNLVCYQFWLILYPHLPHPVHNPDCLCESLKYAGTVITASVMGWPKWAWRRRLLWSQEALGSLDKLGFIDLKEMMLKKLVNPGCHKPTMTEDGLYNPFMVILGMVYNWLYHINPDAFGESRACCFVFWCQELDTPQKLMVTLIRDTPIANSLASAVSFIFWRTKASVIPESNTHTFILVQYIYIEEKRK